MNTTMSDAGSFLLEHGIRPSYQRLRIWGYLAATKEHPSVETIYRSLAPDIPTLSRTTVYNSLSLFIEKGIVQPILIEETETRYDADTSQHGHFRCRVCGRVYDFPLAAGGLAPRLPAGFKAELVQLCCQGVCASCAAADAALGLKA
jgi:Fur family transcriptional regulator, peroxide stress response regulator